jgi:hypothetical protein
MNRYQTPIPRVAFGLAAVAMTALTIGVTVVLPAKMDSNGDEPRVLAASKVTTPVAPGGVTPLRESQCRRSTRASVVHSPVQLVETEPQSRRLS